MTEEAGDWALYRTFLAVLAHGSLSGAARALGLAQPTVGRQVAALERQLQLALFTRSQLGLQATDAARALQPHAQAMQHNAAALQRAAEGEQASGTGVRGTVRITASEVIGVEVLPPILAQLRQQHPALKLELVLSNQVQDLLQREADIAVRMLRPRQNQLVARRVGAIAIGLHAHPDYLERHGRPRHAKALREHRLIGFDQPSEFLRQLQSDLPDLQREAFTLRADSDLAQLALIRAGAGIGMCQVPLAQRAPALVRLLPKRFNLSLDTWVVMHEDQRHSPRCRVAFEALAEGLQRYMA